jgi:hypothetical protein
MATAAPKCFRGTLQALGAAIKSSGSSLGALRLVSAGLSDKGMAVLAAGIRENNSLTALNLSANPFGADGIASLGRYAHSRATTLSHASSRFTPPQTSHRESSQ